MSFLRKVLMQSRQSYSRVGSSLWKDVERQCHKLVTSILDLISKVHLLHEGSFPFGKLLNYKLTNLCTLNDYNSIISVSGSEQLFRI